jgi:hypothetical protein
MIVNDYTGRNIQNSYLEMFDIFSKEKLLSNVIFDIILLFIVRNYSPSTGSYICYVK